MITNIIYDYILIRSYVTGNINKHMFIVVWYIDMIYRYDIVVWYISMICKYGYINMICKYDM